MNKLFNQGSNSYLKEIIEELNESKLFKVEITEINCLELYQALEQFKACKVCQGIELCSFPSKGYRPFATEYGVVYGPCKKLKLYNQKIDNDLNKDVLYFPRKILEYELSDYRIDTPERLACYQHAHHFISGNEDRGMYIYGPFGVGKTFLLAAIANELGKVGKTSLLVSFPDLVRDMKSSIDAGDLEDKISRLKSVYCLLIDDIGSENMSSWFRDEILSPILNYRSIAELPTFFTSNLNITELATHLSNTKDGKDSKKGPRIVERIFSMTKQFEVRK